MLFETSITIAAGKTPADPEVKIMGIAHGIINKIMVRPRPGHHALAHLVILHHEHQIAPSTKGGDFAGDTFPIDWEEYFESYQPPYELKLKGWNDDDTYEHTFDVFVAVLPPEAIPALTIPGAIRNLLKLLSPKRIITGRG